MKIKAIVWSLPLILSLGVSPLLQADAPVAGNKPLPDRIQPGILILSADWLDKIPPRGSVNYPQFLESLYPGQKVALAIAAEGPDQERLLKGLELSVRLSAPGQGVLEERGLKPVAIRRIKAQGADFVMAVLNAGGILKSDQGAAEKAISATSFAVFQPAWTVPALDHAEDVQISATISGGPPAALLKPISIKIRPAVDWLNDPPVSLEEVGQYLNCYHEDLSPGRLLFLLKSAATSRRLNPSLASFFVTAYRERPAARGAALALFPSLEPLTQEALTAVLRLGASSKDPRNFPPIQDSVTPQTIKSVAATMDECWSGWMATGDQSYLRALVGLLSGAPDFPAYQAWVNTRGGAKGLNASVVRGLIYQIAGWSIGSFERTDPHVADWILFWENDPSFPPLLRHELVALPGNPAFRRH